MESFTPDRYIYLVSNGSTHIYENTLTKFTNNLYKTTSKPLEVAVSEVFIDDHFQNSYLPSDPNTPAIILTKKKFDRDEIDLSSFSIEEKYFLKHGQYTSEKLKHSLLSSRRSKNNPILPFIWSYGAAASQTYFGVFSSNKDFKVVPDALDFILYVYKPLAEIIREPETETEPLKVVSINGLTFEVFEPTPVLINNTLQSYFFKYSFKKFEIATSYSPHVFVCCPEISTTYINQSKANILCSLTLEHDKSVDDKKHYGMHHTFETLMFMKLNHSGRINIKLVDSNLKQLQLLGGRATIVKLVTREIGNRNKMSNDLRITVTSSKQHLHNANTSSRFTSELYERIRLYGRDWYCALVSASIPNRFELPLDNLTMTISVTVFHDSHPRRESITIGKETTSIEDILKMFSNQLRRQDELAVDIDPYTGALQFTAKKDIRMIMKGSLAYFLGADEETQNTPILNYTIKADSKLPFRQPPRFNLYHPTSVFLYSDIIEESIVVQQSLKLMKILPVTHDINSNTRRASHLEFKKLEWHRVTDDTLSKLSFELRTQSGDFVNFARQETDHVVLNLIFSQTPNEIH